MLQEMSPAYREDVAAVAKLDLPWERLRGKTVLLTGGTGLIGGMFADVLLSRPENIRLVFLGRNEMKVRARFGTERIGFHPWDMTKVELPDVTEDIDFVVHLASHTHPVAYATDPIGTIAGNVMATNVLLSLAAARRNVRFLFASSNEIYGENRGDVELFDESYCGYIDCNTLRAGYPESKRCGEALCQAYVKQRQLDCVIARLTRTFGPGALPDDSKAVNQFLRNACEGRDIVLKSEGRQYYSFLYVADSVAGLLTVLLRGACGEAYNIADEKGDVTLRDLATCIAETAGRKVVFQLPNAVEKAGFSKATKARLDGTKLRDLGWTARYDIVSGVRRCMDSMKSLS